MKSHEKLSNDRQKSYTLNSSANLTASRSTPTILRLPDREVQNQPMPIASVLLLMAGGVFGGMAMLTLRRWSIRHPAPHSLIIEQDDADLERRILKLEGAA